MKTRRCCPRRRAVDADLAAHQLGQLLGSPGPGRCRRICAWSRCRPGRRTGTACSIWSGVRPMPVSWTSKRTSEPPVVLAQLPHAHDHRSLLGELDRVASKLISTWPSRSGSPRRSSGTPRVDVDDSSRPLPRPSPQMTVGDAGDDVLELEVHATRRQLAGLDLREVEDVVDDAEQVLAGALDLRDVVALLGVERGLERQVRHADDRVHRRADLMAHVGQEVGLQRVASSATSLARRSSSSARLRSVMSRIAKTMRVPLSVSIGLRVISRGISRPSRVMHVELRAPEPGVGPGPERASIWAGRRGRRGKSRTEPRFDG